MVLPRPASALPSVWIGLTIRPPANLIGARPASPSAAIELVGFGKLVELFDRREFAQARLQHGVAGDRNLGVRSLEDIVAQEAVAAHRIDDGVVAAGRLDARNLGRIEGRRVFGVGRKGGSQQQPTQRQRAGQYSQRYTHHTLPVPKDPVITAIALRRGPRASSVKTARFRRRPAGLQVPTRAV